MKTTLLISRKVLLTLLLGLCAMNIVRAQVVITPPNYTITTPGGQFEFQVNGVNTTSNMVSGTDDSLNFSLNAGATYIFSVSTSTTHPMDINTAPNTQTASRYSGATPQNTNSGNVILTIPATNYPANLYYICQIHSFYGIITVNPPQPPPTAKITKTSLSSTNIVLTFSGGTNTISMVPQFSSNLVSGAWLPVPKYTNTYSGTGSNNTTSFSRLDAVCGPDVFLRISQAAN